jgi:uncharacterized membrane protein YqjE
MSVDIRIPPELVRHMKAMATSRLELITVEAEEVRDQAQHMLGLALGLMVLSIMAGLTLTAALVLALWPYGPSLVLTVIGSVGVLGAIVLHSLLFRGLRKWRPFAASLDQIRRDRSFVTEHFS